jgi:hypothetical protein
MWSIGNEEGWVQTNSHGKRMAQTMMAKLAQLDPTRTCTYAADLANVFKGINEVIPVRSFNYQGICRGRLPPRPSHTTHHWYRNGQYRYHPRRMAKRYYPRLCARSGYHRPLVGKYGRNVVETCRNKRLLAWVVLYGQGLTTAGNLPPINGPISMRTSALWTWPASQKIFTTTTKAGGRTKMCCTSAHTGTLPHASSRMAIPHG